MKNLLALVGLVVVSVAGLGWYLGWYQLGTQAGSDGHRIINVDVNTNKVTGDLKKGGQQAVEAISNQTKGTPEKTVEGQTTGIQFDRDGSAIIVLPKIEIK